jgi:hypothetical protein
MVIYRVDLQRAMCGGIGKDGAERISHGVCTVEILRIPIRTQRFVRKSLYRSGGRSTGTRRNPHRGSSLLGTEFPAVDKNLDRTRTRTESSPVQRRRFPCSPPRPHTPPNDASASASAPPPPRSVTSTSNTPPLPFLRLSSPSLPPAAVTLRDIPDCGSDNHTY